MSPKKYDVIVVGLGAMGSAALYQLAKKGVSVLGIEQFTSPHDRGSSTGDTRITRLAIGEGARYAPLVKRSHEIWRDIEAETGTNLMEQCGGLVLSIPNSPGFHGFTDFIGQTIGAAVQYNVDHEVLTTSEIRERFPAFNITDGTRGCYEPTAGMLFPEKCIDTQIKIADKLGANIRFSEKLLSYNATDNEVVVVTDKARYTANKIIITVGSWINEVVPQYAHLFGIYRQVQYWFDLKDKENYESYHKLPVYIWGFGHGHDDNLYGFPPSDGSDGGMKIGMDNAATQTSPDQIDRHVSDEEIDYMYEHYVQKQFPGLSRDCVKTKTCVFTVTPDHSFVIDFHPEHKNVIIASPCSGHGFKHSAAIGEVLSELATIGTSTIDISPFALDRFN